jgi:hypothetical protein
MTGAARGSGPRSNSYSEQKFANWRPNSPYWAEVETLNPEMRPRLEVERASEAPLGVFDRSLSPGFVRPWSIDDVAEVLTTIPGVYLADLAGVFLLGGTSRQRNLKKITYGMYSSGRIFLFALPEVMLVQHWRSMPKPSVVKEYTKFGATVTSAVKGRATLRFDESSLRLFYLYDVLLHEVGHHVDRTRQSDDAERYAHWFAEFQHARLLAP